eukprot:1703216-Alexandrium_andersonii.AAC.1
MRRPERGGASRQVLTARSSRFVVLRGLRPAPMTFLCPVVLPRPVCLPIDVDRENALRSCL